MQRRTFIRTTGLIATRLSLAEKAALGPAAVYTNKLPQWKGFNLLIFLAGPQASSQPTTEDHFKWMEDWGFDFIRLPIAYPYYLQFDRSRNILPEEVYHIRRTKVAEIDQLGCSRA